MTTDLFTALDVRSEVQRFARAMAADPEMSSDKILDAILGQGFDVEAMAWCFANGVAMDAHREAVRDRERAAVLSPPEPRRSPPPPVDDVHASYPWNRKGRIACNKCGCPECVAALERYVDSTREVEQQIATEWSKLMEDIQDGIHDQATRLAQEIHAEWTADLLGSTFALRDGTKVTWGSATQAQHRERVEMLTKHAAGTVETAALHERALQDIAKAKVHNLAEIDREV